MDFVVIACYWKNNHWDCNEFDSMVEADRKAKSIYEDGYDFGPMRSINKNIPNTNINMKDIIMYHPKYSYVKTEPIYINGINKK